MFSRSFFDVLKALFDFFKVPLVKFKVFHGPIVEKMVPAFAIF